ncbi:unnamed protein product [Rotaria socialis]|nr:unnamed protein product [Rotaria socialis]
MTFSFYNNDKLLKLEEWNISTTIIKKQFCAQICDHYQIDQSSNKFEVIKVVQEKEDNGSDIFVVHTLVHPPHGETVTKELMTNDQKSYDLVHKLQSLLKHNIRLITLGHFGMQVMNPKWNRVYGHVLSEPGSTFWPGIINRGGKPYFCPKGWKRYSLKVADNEAEFDRRWGTWHIAYHGTKGELVSAILQSGLKVSTHGCYLKRPSVYVSPSIEYSAHPRYSRIWQNSGSGKYYQLVLQCRVNPRVVSDENVHLETLLKNKAVVIDPNFTNKELEWVIPGANSKDEYITDDIVCYGLMVRSSDVHPEKLPPSHWWSVSNCWK